MFFFCFFLLCCALENFLTKNIKTKKIKKAAQENGVTVAEVTGSNVVSVAEHVVMQILALVRNYIPCYKQVINGEWDIAAAADRAWDLESLKIY